MRTDGILGPATSGVATWQDPVWRAGALAWATEHLAPGPLTAPSAAPG